MKRLILLIAFLAFALGSVLIAQPTQAKIERTGGLVITVYAKPSGTVPAGTNLNILFAVSLPNDGPASLVGASLIGGTITPAPTETYSGRKCYPYILEVPSSPSPLTGGNDNPIATVTFPTSESGDVVQINDFTGQGAGNVYWYISYNGIDNTNYDELFYGTNATNNPGGDSYAEASLPLPVSLVSFRANKFQDRSSLLNWSTVSEYNSSHFSVQRSADRKLWTTVGKVNAAGNSQLVENYQYLDENVYNGSDTRLTVYYRLQMVDIDGQQKNSPIETVVFGNDGGLSKSFEALVYPNPASEGLQVEWDANNIDQPTLLELYDVTGKLVYQQKVSDNTHQEYIDFGPAQIQPGLYLLRILNGTEPLDHKQIVVGQGR